MYELTASGEELRPILSQLAQWGERLLPDPDTSGFRVDHRWALASMASSYVGGLADGSYQLDIDGDELHLVISKGSARLHYGPAVEKPLLVLRCTQEWFFIRATSGDAPQAGHDTPSIDEDTTVLDTLFDALPLPTTKAR